MQECCGAVLQELGGASSWTVRLAVTAAIATLLPLTGCCDSEKLPRAFQNLGSEKPSDRNKALQVIAQCGSRSESVVPRIAQLMYDENVGVASSAAYALRKIDSKAARAALKDAERRRSAARR
jgi:HEAT repeat protein